MVSARRASRCNPPRRSAAARTGTRASRPGQRGYRPISCAAQKSRLGRPSSPADHRAKAMELPLLFILRKPGRSQCSEAAVADIAERNRAVIARVAALEDNIADLHAAVEARQVLEFAGGAPVPRSS